MQGKEKKYTVMKMQENNIIYQKMFHDIIFTGKYF